jgi:iron complex transport system ATP-binding protein
MSAARIETVLLETALIETRQLGIGYSARTIGADLNVSLKAGEVLCLLGPNGSGKTTLFKSMLGLIAVSSGEVRVQGEPLGALSRAEIARRVSYVPQAHAAHFPFSVADMVVMGRTAHQGLFAMPSAADREAASAALAQVRIEGLRDQDYTRLSGGQRQLVLIARALAQAAPAIIMDEPTASLDFGNQVLVLREVRKLADAGLGIILSTHDPDHAFAIADRVALLNDGRILGIGGPADVLTPARLSEVYGVEVEIARLADGRTICVPSLAGTAARR